ncbi:Inosose dehydratase [compost metagenome]
MDVIGNHMGGLSRRGFLGGLAGAALLAMSPGLCATPRKPEIGVQLWMLRELLAADFEGTLGKLRALGVSQVEMAGFFGRSAVQLRDSFSAAGLGCPSVHSLLLHMGDDEVKRQIAFCRELGVKYLVAPMPGLAAAVDESVPLLQRAGASMKRGYDGDDWRWNVERLNWIGERVADAGMRFAYHNHNLEFAVLDDDTAMDLLIRGSDPALVTFELDVGNLVLAGADPLAYLATYHGRFELAHLKDWQGPLRPTTQLDYPPSAAFGAGVIDWDALLPALTRAGVKQCFVELENIEPAVALGEVERSMMFFAKR